MGMQIDAGGGKKGKKSLTPNINVTPLVDVVLVLLIIFMVVLPNMQDGKTIEMFKASTAEKKTYSQDTIESIAVQCGYESPSSFCRTFRKHVKSTPGAYREKARARDA